MCLCIGIGVLSRLLNKKSLLTKYPDRFLSVEPLYTGNEKNSYYLTTTPVDLEFRGSLKCLNSKPVHFIMKIFLYKSLMTCIPRFLNIFFQPLTSWRLSEADSVSMV